METHPSEFMEQYIPLAFEVFSHWCEKRIRRVFLEMAKKLKIFYILLEFLDQNNVSFV